MNKKVSRVSIGLTLCILMAFLVVNGTLAQSTDSPPGQRVVTVNCTKGSDGAAVGEYGGTPFSVACHEDRNSVTISVDPEDDSYSATMLTTSQSGQNAACFHSGDSRAVAKRCGDVVLTIN